MCEKLVFLTRSFSIITCLSLVQKILHIKFLINFNVKNYFASHETLWKATEICCYIFFAMKNKKKIIFRIISRHTYFSITLSGQAKCFQHVLQKTAISFFHSQIELLKHVIDELFGQINQISEKNFAGAIIQFSIL